MTASDSMIAAMQTRISVRSYQSSPIEPERLSALQQRIQTLEPGPFGGQPRLVLQAATQDDEAALWGLTTYGFIRGATAFLVGACRPGTYALEDFGYQVEQVILFATQLGIGTCWLGGSFGRSGFRHKVQLMEGEILPAVVAMGVPAPKSGLVDQFIHRQVRPRDRKPWERLFFDRAWRNPLPPPAAGAYAQALEMVRLAPSASNKQPWRIVHQGTRWHFYLRRTRGYRENWVSKLMSVEDMQRIDMGIALAHFELAARELQLPGGWQTADPGIGGLDPETSYLCTWVEAPG